MLFPAVSRAYWTENLYSVFDVSYAGGYTGLVTLSGHAKENCWLGAFKFFTSQDGTRLQDSYCADIRDAWPGRLQVCVRGRGRRRRQLQPLSPNLDRQYLLGGVAF